MAQKAAPSIRLCLKGLRLACGLGIFLGGLMPSHAADTPPPARTLHLVRHDAVPQYGLFPKEPGLCDEIYGAIGEKLAEKGITLSITPQRFPIQRIIAMLSRGEADAFCGAGVTEEREKTLIYSVLPLYTIQTVLVSRIGDPLRPKRLDDLIGTGEPVMAFFGTTGAERLKAMEGLIVDDGFPDMVAALKLLASKSRYRFLYYNDIGSNYLIREHKLPLQITPLAYPPIPQWMLYAPSLSKDIRLETEDAIATLTADHTLKNILSRY